MANIISALKVLLPKRSNPKGTASTSTFNKSNSGNVLSAPAYRDHLTDIFDSRTSLDSRSLIKQLFITDPDMSAAVSAYLTVADTTPIFVVKDPSGQVDPAGQEILNQLLTALTTRTDYSKGFKIVQSLRSICEDLRYLVLLRGGLAAELVVSKEFLPAEIRLVDMATIEWFEKAPAQYTPRQSTPGGEIIELDIPTFFTSWYHQDPTAIYSTSPFVSAINTIAARQQVVNDLYRIMRITGYPRMEITVLEEVLLKHAPPAVLMDETSKTNYVRSQLATITQQIAAIGPEQTFVHTDSIEAGMVNEKSSATTLNIDSVMGALNAQNQAALRTMATIIGRGEAGVNTATVEARVFSMNADSINKPIADLLAQIFTMGIRLQGSQSYVEVNFAEVELKSAIELETMMLVRSQRLKEDLSLGLITDAEYHLKMYNRLPPAGSPTLSGTGFQNAGAGAAVDTTAISPNQDALGRSVSHAGGAKPARDNKMGKSKVQSGGK